MQRCTICQRPMRYEYVELPRIGLDGKPEQFRNVKRYECPEGCRGVTLDFSEARPISSGVHLKVVGKVKPLKKEADFNDRLLAVGLVIGYAILVTSIAVIQTVLPLKIAAIVFLTLALFGVYRFANKRVELPSYYFVPIPSQDDRPVDPERTAPAAAAPQTSAATATATPAGTAAEAQAEGAAPAEGNIPMQVVLAGEQFDLMINEGENMLDAALDRDVDVDYSCLEGLCDSCEVKVLEGGENITAPTQEEYDMLGENEVNSGKRLACQVVVNGPIRIEQ